MADINEHLALNVMNWEIYIPNNRSCVHEPYYSEHSQNTWKLKCPVDKWNPQENIKQAVTCAEKIGIWYMENDGLGSYVAVVRGFKEIVHDYIEMPRAISLACARATIVATLPEEQGYPKECNRTTNAPCTWSKTNQYTDTCAGCGITFPEWN